MSERKTILFMAEVGTLAHVARTWLLAKALDPVRYKIVFAANHEFDALFDMRGWQRETLDSKGSAAFLKALDKGSPLYDKSDLIRYVEEDRALIDRIQPDLIVGDFRLSLSVSARLAEVPYATLSNIYWSPYAVQRYTVPTLRVAGRLSLSGLLGPLAQPVFSVVRPLAFMAHTFPLNRVRRHYGLPSLGSNLRRVYTDADYVLYADFPHLANYRALPPNHRFLGPVVWSPQIDLPAWWDELSPSLPTVYATLGSSGDKNLLPHLVEVLGEMPVNAMVAAASGQADKVPGNVFVAKYLPGGLACARSDLVICNGGSPTVQQALTSGAPVLGLAGNLDQFLNMGPIQSAGLGLCLRADKFRGRELRVAVDRILTDRTFHDRARGLAAEAAASPAEIRFREFVEEVL